MTGDHQGTIDYAVSGDGPAIVFVPGSCSTGSAWKPVISAWGPGWRFVTTSLPGYGGTHERRTATDTAMTHVAEAVEAVIRRTGATVHLVGHSFGGLVALAVAMRRHTPLASLSLIEPPALGILQHHNDVPELHLFGQMCEHYERAFAGGQRDAVAAMIDFYGGAGTFTAWPERARNYAMETTHVNLLDWSTARNFALSKDALTSVEVPTLLLCGGDSHPAMKRIIARLGAGIPMAEADVIARASHFMIATHAADVAARLRRHITHAEQTAQLPAADRMPKAPSFRP